MSDQQNDLLYTEDEEALRDSVRGALKRGCSTATLLALYDEPDTDVAGLWRTLAVDMGLAGLLVPEDRGGAGAGPREAATVLEELGRGVAPVPFLTSAVIATQALLGTDDSAVLPRLAAGEVTAALVLPWTAHRGEWEPVSGAVQPVAGALDADVLLVPVADGDDVALRLVPREQAEVTPLISFDMTRRLARVEVPADAGDVIATGAAARDAVDDALGLGAALLASEQLGLAQWCVQTTVEYGLTRVQFARPIGSFQAIKHRLADLFTEQVLAQASARQAAVAASLPAGEDERLIAEHVAATYCSDMAVHAAEEALQLHGGIGMTWEHPLHLYLKRAKANQLALGTPERHRAALAGVVDLPA
ncbi:MAG: acyl-CoA dehydrogenase family protein [Mobilicoccus sp.]|nr:acyl-CoA dehydrogenase family protein [Mobilicoccus sp.]